MHVNDPAALLLEAVAFAAEKHRHQRRKDAEASPYINHPIALASLLNAGASATSRSSAPRCCTTRSRTRTRPPTSCACTSARSSPPSCSRSPTTRSSTRPSGSGCRWTHAHALSERAKLVKLADKICNLCDMVAAPPASWTLERKREYLTGRRRSSTRCAARIRAWRRSSTTSTRRACARWPRPRSLAPPRGTCARAMPDPRPGITASSRPPAGSRPAARCRAAAAGASCEPPSRGRRNSLRGAASP